MAFGCNVNVVAPRFRLRARPVAEAKNSSVQSGNFSRLGASVKQGVVYARVRLSSSQIAELRNKRGGS
jgi:hypothetical protein